MKFKSSDLVWINGQPYAKDSPLAKRVYEDQANYGAQPVGGLATTEPKQNTVRPLDRKPSPRKSRKGSVVLVIGIQPYVRRQVDEDNFGSGPYKSLRDAIARSLGIDDGDSRIKFEYYAPIITTGAVGTQVLISKV